MQQNDLMKLGWKRRHLVSGLRVVGAVTSSNHKKHISFILPPYLLYAAWCTVTQVWYYKTDLFLLALCLLSYLAGRKVILSNFGRLLKKKPLYHLQSFLRRLYMLNVKHAVCPLQNLYLQWSHRSLFKGWIWYPYRAWMIMWDIW